MKMPDSGDHADAGGDAAGVGRRSLVKSLSQGAIAANLLAMYSFLLDSADYAKWGALFHETGTLELNGAVWAQGSDGIAKKMAEVMAQNPKPVTGITGEHMYRHI